MFGYLQSLLSRPGYQRLRKKEGTAPSGCPTQLWKIGSRFETWRTLSACRVATLGDMSDVPSPNLSQATASAALLFACVAMTGLFPRPLPAQRLALPGNPLSGITVEEFERFRLGLEDFVEVEDAAEGLGPAYNGTGCSACHNSPAIGGISPVSEVRAGRLDAEGNFEVLGGGTLFHIFSIPNHSCQPIIPPEANVVTKRVPIPLFGADLVEAISDETLLGLEDPDDLDNDGISGRAARIIDVGTGRDRIGRFGWKSQHATLLAFGADAYRNEMGITNDLFVDEVAAGVDPEALELCDLRPDPEDAPEPGTGLRGIDNFEAFMKFLAPIGRAPLTEQATWGEGLFDSVGCAACHIPVLQTGRDSNPLFNEKPVALYSDLLLHDAGTGDGIAQEAALPNEVRTPSLWGLRLRRPLLHDGSAANPEQAVLAHGAEAESARLRFEELSEQERAALLAFLDSL